jgi:hypothetical protein
MASYELSFDTPTVGKLLCLSVNHTIAAYLREKETWSGRVSKCADWGNSHVGMMLWVRSYENA